MVVCKDDGLLSVLGPNQMRKGAKAKTFDEASGCPDPK